MKIGTFCIMSLASIGLGVFLGVVPLDDGRTGSDILEDMISGPGSDVAHQVSQANQPKSDEHGRGGGSGSAKVAAKGAGASAPSSEPARKPGRSAAEQEAKKAVAHVNQAAPQPKKAAQPAVQATPAAVAEPQAPITAGAANSPEQASASDKAALDMLISRKARN